MTVPPHTPGHYKIMQLNDTSRASQHWSWDKQSHKTRNITQDQKHHTRPETSHKFRRNTNSHHLNMETAIKLQVKKHSGGFYIWMGSKVISWFYVHGLVFIVKFIDVLLAYRQQNGSLKLHLVDQIVMCVEISLWCVYRSACGVCTDQIVVCVENRLWCV